MARCAVVLMNLGGPDRLAAVRPFLFNLFSDPAIVRLPAWLRWPLAWLIAVRRAAKACEIYRQLGGASPLLANTEVQARALAASLGPDYRCFVAMRYWRPLSRETVSEVRAWQPDEIVLLPLYPQFSTTTTASSIAAWQHEAERQGLNVPTTMIRSYPAAPGLIAALADVIGKALDEVVVEGVSARLLLSAHGLPLSIVRAGDPYPAEIERTAAALTDALGRSGLATVVCYQSRVGPLAWLGPSVDEELQRAGRDRVGVVIAPISFVSEHSETLVELDRDYRRAAERYGVPIYRRVPTVSDDSRFIAALAELVRRSAVGSDVGEDVGQVSEPSR